MFDVDDTNYISVKHIQPGTPIMLPFKEGLYYLHLSPWSGRQLVAGNNENRNKLIPAWNEYSNSIKGLTKVVLKYADNKAMKIKLTEAGVIPICTVDKYGLIFQALSSDIFTAYDLKPGTVTPTQMGEDGKLMIKPFTVNRIVPTLDDEYLDASPAPELSVSGEGYVAVLCSYEPDTFFPRNASIEFIDGTDLTDYADTTESSYFLLAKVNVAGTGASKVYSIVQYSASNLVVNRVKAGENEAVWWWDEMG